MPAVLRRIGIASFVVLAALLLVAAAWVGHRARDRHPGYRLDLRVAGDAPGPLRAGFAAVAITPPVVDTWTDRNGNARLDPGEPVRDVNRNGRFDAYWLAGFHDRRPATGVHDDLWARAMVLDDGKTVLAVVVLDAIGLMHDRVVEIRRRVPPEVGVTYTVVASTHSHQAPDLMGLWGGRTARSGVNPDYLEQVIDGAAAAVTAAARARRPAALRFAQVPQAAAPLVTDSRRPIVLDPGLRMLHAVSLETGESLGVFVTWANHPETLWSGNLEVSSDFPHYLREGIESGVVHGGRTVAPGLGGVAVYASGAIGGLMTTSPDFPIPDPFGAGDYRRPGFAKARAQGQGLALLVLEALRSPAVVEVGRAGLALRARTLEVPLENLGLALAAALGIVERGFPSWGTVRSEVAAFRIGPASFLAIPGEIYPEIVNGGIETPPGADFPVDAVEVPPLRGLMPGSFKFVIGLANDELGYIIPRSQWDAEAPWLYGEDEETYGEIVSMGPGTAPLLHAALREILADL
jgi:hypothetical protein